MKPNDSNSEIDFKSLIASAERAKQEPSVIELDFGGTLNLIIAELEKIEKNPTHEFFETLRYTIIDSMPWSIPFFRELMNFLGEHDKYHKELNKLKRQDSK